MKTSTLIILAFAFWAGVYHIIKDEKQPGNAPATIATGEPSPAAPVTDPNLIQAALQPGKTVYWGSSSTGVVELIDNSKGWVYVRSPKGNLLPIPIKVITKVA